MKTYLCQSLVEESLDKLSTLSAGGRRFNIIPSSGFHTEMDSPDTWPEEYPNDMYAGALDRDKSVGRENFLYRGKKTVYRVNPETRELVKLPEYPSSAWEMCHGWLLCPKKGYQTMFFHTVSQSTYTVPYKLIFPELCGDSEVLAKCRDGSSLSNLSVVRMNLDTQEILWKNDKLYSSSLLPVPDKFIGEYKGVISICSLQTGEKLRDLDGFEPAQKFDTPECVRRYNYITGIFHSYDVAVDKETRWKLGEFDGEFVDYSLTMSGDEIVAWDKKKKRLRLYRYSTQELLGDYPFNPPVKVLGYIFKTHGGYCFAAVAHEPEYYGSGLLRTWLFTLEELEGSNWEPEHEPFLCSHERIKRDDGDVDYHVSFPEPQPLSMLYRHTGCYTAMLGHKYGSMVEEQDGTDEEWTGLIEVDLRNQTLDEQARLEIRTACMHSSQGFSLSYLWCGAGVDVEEPIVIKPVFDDE